MEWLEGLVVLLRPSHQGEIRCGMVGYHFTSELENAGLEYSAVLCMCCVSAMYIFI